MLLRAAQMHSCQGTQLAPKQRLCHHTEEETDLNMRIHLRRVKLQELPTRTARRGIKINLSISAQGSCNNNAAHRYRLPAELLIRYHALKSERCKPTRASTYLIGILGAMREYRTGQGPRAHARLIGLLLRPSPSSTIIAK